MHTVSIRPAIVCLAIERALPGGARATDHPRNAIGKKLTKLSIMMTLFRPYRSLHLPKLGLSANASAPPIESHTPVVIVLIGYEPPNWCSRMSGMNADGVMEISTGARRERKTTEQRAIGG